MDCNSADQRTCDQGATSIPSSYSPLRYLPKRTTHAQQPRTKYTCSVRKTASPPLLRRVPSTRRATGACVMICATLISTHQTTSSHRHCIECSIRCCQHATARNIHCTPHAAKQIDDLDTYVGIFHTPTLEQPSDHQAVLCTGLCTGHSISAMCWTRLMQLPRTSKAVLLGWPASITSCI